jgi:hypothetical protein
MTPSWTSLEPAIDAFLDDFDARGADPQGRSDELFAPTFLVLDPARAVALTPQQLAAMLPARRAMFAKAGVGAVRRQDVRQLRLDERHVLVAGEWAAEREGETLTLSSTFLLRSEPGGYRVLVYLNHRDLSAVLGAPASSG